MQYKKQTKKIKIMYNKTLTGEITAQTTQNVQSDEFKMVDFTEFVKQLGREYGEMTYEAAETPKDLRDTIDWADVNFYEADSLTWMLNEDSEYEEIANVFGEMEWKEFIGYEHIFVDAAKERMEECLSDWKNNLANDITTDYQSKINALADEKMDNELDVLQAAAEIYEEYLQEMDSVYDCEICIADGFALDLTCLGDEFFIEPNPGYDSMQIQYDRLYDRISDLKYAMEFEPVAR